MRDGLVGEVGLLADGGWKSNHIRVLDHGSRRGGKNLPAGRPVRDEGALGRMAVNAVASTLCAALEEDGGEDKGSD